MARIEEQQDMRRELRIGPRDLITAIVIGVVILGIVYALSWDGTSDGDSRSVDVAFNSAFPAPRVGNVSGDSRGQPVWLNFWATWCPPCRAEIPDINAVYAENAPKGLAIVALSLGEDA